MQVDRLLNCNSNTTEGTPKWKIFSIHDDNWWQRKSKWAFLSSDPQILRSVFQFSTFVLCRSEELGSLLKKLREQKVLSCLVVGEDADFGKLRGFVDVL